MTLFGRCDAPACPNDTVFITRGYLADGSSPTYNEACSSHAGDIAANYLRSGSAFVRAEIIRLEHLTETP